MRKRYKSPYLEVTVLSADDLLEVIHFSGKDDEPASKPQVIYYDEDDDDEDNDEVFIGKKWED